MISPVVLRAPSTFPLVHGQCNACAGTIHLWTDVGFTKARGTCNACAEATACARATGLACLDVEVTLAPAARVTRPLPGEHQATLTPATAPSLAVLNAPATYLLHTFGTGRTPADVLAHLPADYAPKPSRAAIEEMIHLGLLVPAGAEPCLPPETPTTLNAWLHVTNACNLNCTYCYVARSDEMMAPEVGYQAVDALLRTAVRHGFSSVRLKYAGGEPSLNFPLVMELHTYARTHAEELGLVLEEVILSNGVDLSDRLLAALLAENIGLAVSLDGLDGHHDAQRPRTDGSSAARAVQRTLERAQALGLCPDVTVTITDRNLDALPETVAWLLACEMPFALNFCREHDRIAEVRDLMASDERLIEGVRRVFRVIETDLPRYSLLNCLLDRVQMAAPHHYPCAAAHNYLVIDHCGRVAQCQMVMDRSVSTIWAEDPLTSVQNALDGISGLSVEEKEGCMACEWRYWCAGGCPLQTYRAAGRYDTRSPLCAVYRALMPDLLRLEGLRLLKYASTAEMMLGQ
jgi:uncharacterized protein